MKFPRRLVSLTIVLAALFGLTASIALAFGATWTQQTGSGQKVWDGIASSADGTKLIAAPAGGDVNYNPDYLYTSTDGGMTWAPSTSAGQKYWSAVASSGDGTKLAATTGNDADGNSDYIYTSMDGGATWMQRTGAGAHSWGPISSSADGTKLAAGVYNNSVTAGSWDGIAGYLYTSTDGGVTWTQRPAAGQRKWTGIASSADGTKLAAVASEDSSENPVYVETSSDGGETWTDQTASGQRDWASIASSADGTKLAAAATLNDNGSNPGYLYTSTDGGVTWTQRTGPGQQQWIGITSSADGTKLAANSECVLFGCPTNDGTIWTSADGGATWVKQTSAGERSWFSITSSADGTKLIAAPSGDVNYNPDYIYTATLSPDAHHVGCITFGRYLGNAAR
jgi:hypothetical protein